MPTFTDTAGREWIISLDAPTITRIRQEFDPLFMLNDSTESNTFTRLQSDPVILCGAVAIICEQQRVDRGISEAVFYAEVIGEGNAIEKATEALLAVMLNFIPLRMRPAVEASVAKQRRIQELALERMTAALNDPKLEERFLSELDENLARLVNWTPPASAIDLPASSASPPAA